LVLHGLAPVKCIRVQKRQELCQMVHQSRHLLPSNISYDTRRKIYHRRAMMPPESSAQPILITRGDRFPAGHGRHFSNHPDGKSHSQPERSARRGYAVADVSAGIDVGIVAAISLSEFETRETIAGFTAEARRHGEKQDRFRTATTTRCDSPLWHYEKAVRT
jgi:hypothetical protein